MKTGSKMDMMMMMMYKVQYVYREIFFVSKILKLYCTLCVCLHVVGLSLCKRC